MNKKLKRRWHVFIALPGRITAENSWDWVATFRDRTDAKRYARSWTVTLGAPPPRRIEGGGSPMTGKVVMTILTLASLAACGSVQASVVQMASERDPALSTAPPTSSATVLAYTDPLSLVQCSTLGIYVSSPSPAYTVDFQRFGEAAPVTVASMGANDGFIQTTAPDAAANGAGWSQSVSYSDTCNWPTGMYAARVNAYRIGPTGTAVPTVFYSTFVVRPLNPPTTPTLLVVASTNTWNAYNPWPSGGSFYSEGGPTRVSYLRPNPGASLLLTTSHLAGGELHILQWLEAHNYAYDLVSDIDLNDSPSILNRSNYYAVVLSTHSEYWTDSMYSSLSSYLHAGGSLLSLSGNTMYRRETMITPVGGQWSSQLVGGTKTLRAPAQVAALIGLSSHYAGWVDGHPTTDTCAPYRVLLPKSFLLTGVRSKVFGITGQDIPAGCYHNPAGVTPGASGWEEDSYYRPAGARTYQIVAAGMNPGGGADLVYYRPYAGGQVVNFGSIAVGNSLAVDPYISRIVEDALLDFLKIWEASQ